MVKIGKIFNLKRVKQLALGTIALLLLASTAIVEPIQNSKVAQAVGTPRFNFRPGDTDLLQMKNATKGGSYGDPITAEVGDEIIFQLYFHNGEMNTVAQNTTVRVDIRNINSVTNPIKAEGWIWARGVEPINETRVGGTVVGQPGGTINLDEPARLEYVAGSTYRSNPKIDANGNYVRDGSGNIIWDNTRLGDTINYASGVSIGDVNGCWTYAGYVYFRMKVVEGANLGVSKFVRKASEPTNWNPDVRGARPGDNVAFAIGVKNNGGTVAGTTVIKDRLPQNLNYKPNTTKIRVGEDGTETPVADGKLFTTAGLPVASLQPGQSLWVTYEAQVDPGLNAGDVILQNLAEVFMNNVKQGQGIATVYANGDNPGLNIAKGVFQGTSVVEQTTANLNENVKWQIIVSNTGNTTVNGVVIRDVLPLYNNYVPGTIKVNNVAVQDVVMTELMSTAGRNFGNMLKNQAITITFETKIFGCVAVGGYDVLNTAYVKADGIVEKRDTAGVRVNITAPVL